MAKTRKAISKRFKFTRNGKIMRRAVGQDHYLSKQTSKKRRRIRKLVEVSPSEIKAIKKMAQR
ncbi:MAG: 50S ribosomal protein L35 [Candidatus Wildermuthbacteria bacterium RIFCSPHIGHO2_12_FULL_45_9]|uniref:Large ribosomal subunit protein bL35 n=1 Tax=Candidatus Wildermuthbacteria bacterium RIFCSPHIGHO2_02_FULL_45_25 TaxID=1802450 RepID=A0A1G2R2Q3_9BACT|nr:MAG: 50S ribosomal protein L35 [Candidatus Wildermuthbacteria bacterium RIFCSPHIGHO2_01_FULL_45_20]OHA66679.1 MAG: 50S ribosomal protein L35 [Candidatus Wildermuthbacteria bacterium RIFCSPHIGHO2_02_FULL_45_25]OHA70291.1 MAG: 50S ribosomal protein L35 [Candidatus Wildermuthbacteria bacterium RIFCSPHIGHO2_12_FULL_45_9]